MCSDDDDSTSTDDDDSSGPNATGVDGHDPSASDTDDGVGADNSSNTDSGGSESGPNAQSDGGGSDTDGLADATTDTVTGYNDDSGTGPAPGDPAAGDDGPGTLGGPSGPDAGGDQAAADQEAAARDAAVGAPAGSGPGEGAGQAPSDQTAPGPSLGDIIGGLFSTPAEAQTTTRTISVPPGTDVPPGVYNPGTNPFAADLAAEQAAIPASGFSPEAITDLDPTLGNLANAMLGQGPGSGAPAAPATADQSQAQSFGISPDQMAAAEQALEKGLQDSSTNFPPGAIPGGQPTGGFGQPVASPIDTNVPLPTARPGDLTPSVPTPTARPSNLDSLGIPTPTARPTDLTSSLSARPGGQPAVTAEIGSSPFSQMVTGAFNSVFSPSGPGGQPAPAPTPSLGPGSTSGPAAIGGGTSLPSLAQFLSQFMGKGPGQ